MNIQEFKQQNPAYKDVPDQQLADKLYNKFYSSKLSKDEFYKQVGLQNSQGSEKNNSNNNSTLKNIGEGTANFLLGAGEAATAPFYGVANILGIKAKQPETGAEGFGYGAGKLTGTVLGYAMAGSPFVKTGLKVLESMPAIGKAGSYLMGSKLMPTLGRSALTGSIYEGLSAPEGKRAEYAAYGGIGAPIGELGLKGIKESLKYTPKKLNEYTKNIVDYIGGGKTKEENALSLAKDLRTTRDQKVSAYREIINPILDTTKDVKMLPDNYLTLGDDGFKIGFNNLSIC